MGKRIIVLGGGTYQPIRNHLSLCATAFGNTAKTMSEKLNGELVLTKMADPTSKLVTNEDVSDYIDELLEDKNVGTIVLSVAFCDYKSLPIDNIQPGFHSQRLKTDNGNITIELEPTEKIIGKIRRKRPDIFLVGFKTTTDENENDQFHIALKMMKKTKCNLVLANDTVTRNNMIITPEESIYGNTTDRENIINELSQIILMRNDLTYNYSNFINRKSYSVIETPINFQKVLKYVIDNGGYIENNGNGFTPGHFCFKLDNKSFLSSQRKANHNLVFEEGMSVVNVEDDIFNVIGERKASVGARSQYLCLIENKDMDSIIHTHNPLKKGSQVPITQQKPFQCGSLECGLNTVNHMKEFCDGRIKAVYLEKHGINLMFNSGNNPQEVIDFINSNIILGEKVK